MPPNSSLNKEDAMPPRANRRQRRERRTIAASPLAHIPWLTITNSMPPLNRLDSEAEEKIHEASMRILEEIGLLFMDAEALDMWQHDVVAAIAGRLDATLLARTLDIVFDSESDVDAAECVRTLFPHLDEKLRARAVEAVGRKLKDIARVVALEGIAPELSGPLADAAAPPAGPVSRPAPARRLCVSPARHRRRGRVLP